MVRKSESKKIRKIRVIRGFMIQLQISTSEFGWIASSRDAAHPGLRLHDFESPEHRGARALRDGHRHRLHASAVGGAQPGGGVSPSKLE